LIIIIVILLLAYVTSQPLTGLTAASDTGEMAIGIIFQLTSDVCVT